ncbi:GPR endopeptidase [Sporolactobacillus sp. Y61]|jgi:spore protease|uniref:Germination protease n=1 Tax=Sporolactobacillus sp. Y61 TaxID=3160863 RepID=A0AAU8IEZ2_9BACL|nr:GPR endopeptidase [Sporolactobacillus sp. THM19-2]RYL90384.1 GPR endopeptidase [Sporolactobacillus sp. THM19-2]
MENALDIKYYGVRTDLAIESGVKKGSGLNGVTMDEKVEDGINITRMRIHPDAAASIRKKPGLYLTFEAKLLRSGDTEAEEKAEKVFARYFAQFLKDLNISHDATCLVVGLGNWKVTPDALGPAVVENVLVTKHLFDLQPQNVQKGYRPVSAITPGVMGVTGIETSDIILGVIEKTKPDFLIAVDALAARSIERVNTTIQVADSGIHPGSGIGNNRKELSRDTLGIPVIAVGIPTVVDAVTITSDVLDLVLRHLGHQMNNTSPSSSLVPSFLPPGRKEDPGSWQMPSKENRAAFLGMVGTLSTEEKEQLIQEALGASGTRLMVTPKEVDFFIEKMGNVLAQGLNAALHSLVNQENVGHFTH